MKALTISQYASKIMNGADKNQQIEAITDLEMSLSINDAYRIASEIERRRVLKNEKIIGIKIGFTNRNIWKEYNASAPIVGAMYNTTVFPAYDYFSISNFLEPKIEPEIIFKIKKLPVAEMDDHELLGCIESVAHGFEIVHSVFKGWKFKTADTIAAFGLHGALIHGPFQEIVADKTSEWVRNLTNFDIDLCLNGDKVDRGSASNVLGSGPLEALRHILSEDLGFDIKAALKPGSLITTGTLTGAYPIQINQNWSTNLSGINLEGLRVKFIS